MAKKSIKTPKKDIKKQSIEVNAEKGEVKTQAVVEVVDSEGSGVEYGRQSKTNKELWERRTREMTLFAAGIGVTEIGRKVGVSTKVVIADLQAIQDIKPAINALDRVEAGYLKVIRKAWNLLYAKDVPGKAEYLKIIRDTWEKVARLHGVEGASQGDTLNQYFTQINGKVNSYDKWDDEPLSAELERRHIIEGILE